MKTLVYPISGIIFALGLLISGMIDPAKVKGFLQFGQADWNPALMAVLFSAVIVYFVAFRFVRAKERTFNGEKFGHPAPRPIDRKLVLGSVIFGVGWGLAGLCPGPAIVRAAFLDFSLIGFLIAMFAGFELQRRLS